MGAAVVVAGATHGETAKESYPNRPVRMVVPFAAGGPGDIFARLIAQKLSERLGQQYFIENRPGAGGTIGTGLAARAPADGYTLLVGSSTVWVNASLYPQMPYDPIKDIDPIIIAATSPEALVVHPSVPARNVQELIALVRARGSGAGGAPRSMGARRHASRHYRSTVRRDRADSRDAGDEAEAGGHRLRARCCASTGFRCADQG
jgi:tripartite-type tricarboxylate transporter receptor subunit TctC